MGAQTNASKAQAQLLQNQSEEALAQAELLHQQQRPIDPKGVSPIDPFEVNRTYELCRYILYICCVYLYRHMYIYTHHVY